MRKTSTAIPVTQLLLDTTNPRLPEIQESERNTIQAMVNNQGDRIVRLAQHLVENGTNPASLPIVMPSDDEDQQDRYYVLDGNRRVTALKLLESPSMAEGILSETVYKRLKRLAAQYQEDPIVELQCIICSDRDEADIWIQLIHRGEWQGAGLVGWNGQAAARYDERKGIKRIGLQVLDYVDNFATLSDSTRQRIDDNRFPVTTLERVLQTLYVRQKLGIDHENGIVVTPYSQEEVLKGLRRIVDDIGSSDYTVSDLKSQQQRIEYINTFDQTELPDESKRLSQKYPLGEQPTSPTSDIGPSGTPDPSGGTGPSGTPDPSGGTGPSGTPDPSGGTGPSGTPQHRSALIPRKCKLKINDNRIYRIFAELKKLNLNAFPNCGAVMLRVFIELSLDYFLEKKNTWPEPKRENSTLAQKLSHAVKYMEDNNIMTKDALDPIRKAATGQTLLAASVRTMNAYVHSRYNSPLSSELKVVWDDFQPFMENLWRSI